MTQPQNLTHQVAIVPGDGIGPEIAEATRAIVDAAGASIDWIEAPLGQDAQRRFGQPIPESSLERIRDVGCALKGPLVAEAQSGGVVLAGEKGERRYPSINSALRRELDTFVNLRPARGWQGISGRYADLNVVLVRETTEDVYAGLERRVDEDTAEATKRVTRRASRRVARFAFEYAESHDRRRVTAGHKANLLHLTDGLFLESVREVAHDFAEIDCNDSMIDSLCYRLIKTPEEFDVIVLPSQYGDIVSDVAAGLIGSLGLAPGANIGARVAFFEAAHGAAPDIAGRGIANPISLTLSAALMLDHLEESAAAEAIRAGVGAALAEGRCLTPDLGGRASTGDLTRALCDVTRTMRHGIQASDLSPP